MTDILEGVDEAINEIAQPLVERRAAVLEHRLGLIKQREEADEVLRRIDRALRPLRPDLFETKPKPKTSNGQPRVGRTTKAGTATGFGITVEGCQIYVAEIERQFAADVEYVTQIGVYQKVKGGDQAKSSAAFKYLRQIGYLRKGGIKGRRETWYIDNPTAYQKALEEVTADA